MNLHIGNTTHDFAKPLVMGVINTTPDSFSDGGSFLDVDAAVRHGLKLVDEGADILDIGGESTRPGSEPVDASEEMRRVLPVIEGLIAATNIPISIDTNKALVAREACERGASMINDVTGLSGDPNMVNVVAETGATLCLMHMQGTPVTMQENVTYTDVCTDIEHTLSQAINKALEHDIDFERIVIDPGIGFGKHLPHNLALIQSCGVMASRLKRPILMGVSRKSFLGELTNRSVDQRTYGTAAAITACVLAGAHIVRVHDVAAARDVVAVAHALRNTANGGGRN